MRHLLNSNLLLIAMTRAPSLLLALLLATIALADDTAIPEESPHAAAIRLVMETRGDEIRSLDHVGEWSDTKERSWSARRPFEPGVIDSTHFFTVTYKIDGQIAGTWNVNTRIGQVAHLGESIVIE